MKNDSAVNACEIKYSVAISHLIDLKLFYNPQKDKSKQTRNIIMLIMDNISVNGYPDLRQRPYCK